MAQRALNKVQLIGNLTRDPELRYTPSGTAVCTFGLATNRSWVTETNEKKEDVEFHRLVAWNKLAEICSQLLFKGRRIYTEGRLQTRDWTGKDGVNRQTTEIVVSDMIILDSKRGGETDGDSDYGEPEDGEAVSPKKQPEQKKNKEEKKTGQPAEAKSGQADGKSAGKKTAGDDDQGQDDQKKSEKSDKAEVEPDDIPF